MRHALPLPAPHPGDSTIVADADRFLGPEASREPHARQVPSTSLRLRLAGGNEEPRVDGENAVAALLRLIGEDPTRDGLRETPRRVVEALREMTAGYGEKPSEILSTTFEEASDELIVLRGIEFHSLCEHHLLPFYGTASVGYFPGAVVGISKLARLVHCFARRLQIQERLTRQIAEAVSQHLHARGAAVVVRAHHLCMGCRGVRLPGTELVTSAMLGVLREDASARAEFLSLAGEAR